MSTHCIFILLLAMAKATDYLVPDKGPFCRGANFYSQTAHFRVWSSKTAVVDFEEVTSILNDLEPMVVKTLDTLGNVVKAIDLDPHNQLSSPEGDLIDLSKYNLGLARGGKAVVVKALASAWLDRCYRAFIPSNDNITISMTPGIPLIMDKGDSVIEILRMLKDLNIEHQPVHADLRADGAVNPLTGGLLAGYPDPLNSTVKLSDLALTTLIFLDVSARKYFFSTQQSTVVNGLCYASPMDLERTAPQTVTAIFNVARARLNEFRSKILYFKHLLKVTPTSERLGQEHMYTVTPPPALLSMLNTMKVSSEQINFEDISARELTAFDKLAKSISQFLAAYQIIDRYMAFPLMQNDKIEQVMFRPRHITLKGNYLGELKYFSGSQFSQYTIYPQGYLDGSNVMKIIKPLYLYILDKLHPFTSSTPISRYLCYRDENLGRETCSTRKPKDSSSSCGKALLTSSDWSSCQTSVLKAPTFFANRVCDPYDNDIKMSAPFPLTAYYSCPNEHMINSGVFTKGVHILQGPNTDNTECDYAWSIDDGDDIKIEPLFRGTDVSANMRDFNLEAHDNQITFEDLFHLNWWQVGLSCAGVLIASCLVVCLLCKSYSCLSYYLSCRPCVRKARQKARVLARFMDQNESMSMRQPNVAGVRQHNIINVTPGQNPPSFRQAQVQTGARPIVRTQKHNASLSRAPYFSPPVMASALPLPLEDRYTMTPPTRPPRSETPSALLLMDGELVLWSPVDHKISTDERRGILQEIRANATGGMPAADLPTSVKRRLL